MLLLRLDQLLVFDLSFLRRSNINNKFRGAEFLAQTEHL